ncbi:MAG TPA: hypothetical protein VJ579_00080 [Candidatus Paceibacterota bacterium]|nr:hypothetical protein [Candidatus Paceibacterota bacterium]
MFGSIDKQRLVIGGALFIGVFVLPSILTLIIGALLALRYNNYFEFPVFALLIDAVYRTNSMSTFGLFGFAVIYVLAVDYFRVRIRMRDNRRLY